MKPISLLLLLPLLAHAETQQTPKFRDAATHEQLVKKLKRSDQYDPMKSLKTVEGEDPSKHNQPLDLLEQSDVICFNGLATLVPKRAILATPSNHKDRLSIQPGVRVVGWSEFFAQNRGWITTVEVTRVQAEGNSALSEETAERIGKSRNLIVATFSGGPISVLPLKPTAKPAETSKATP
jgi:hypothetical protein